jgi:prepilin-type N-terminal cleavage/methylation domain-containing protein
MKMKSNNRRRQLGFSMLELTVTTAILALVATASMTLVRTAYTAWNRHDDDQSQRQQAAAVLRHICRQVRQAKAVMAISSAADNSGTLSLLMPSGDTYVWDHNAITKEVAFGIDTASSLLAHDIEELFFRAANVDGSTQVTEVGLIHSILCTVKFNLARPAGNELITVSSQAWLRAW